MFFKRQSFNDYNKTISVDEIAFLKKHVKLKGKLLGIELEDITEITYQDLKHNVPDLFNKSEFEKAIYLILKNYKKNITFTKVKEAKNSDKLVFLLWVKKQYEIINDLEARYLTSDPDIKLLQAGIKELDVLGDVNTIDALAKGDILKWDAIRKLKYSEVFNKLLKNTIEARVNKKLVEINKKT